MVCKRVTTCLCKFSRARLLCLIITGAIFIIFQFILVEGRSATSYEPNASTAQILERGLERTPIIKNILHFMRFISRPLYDSQSYDDWHKFSYNPTNLPETCTKNGWAVRKDSVKLYDAFLFSHELDILEIRLKELYDIVDFFVITESKQTFSKQGQKNLFFNLTKSTRFKKYMPKIIHHITEPGGSLFLAEAKSRNSQQQGLMEAGIKPGDIVFLSDVDEIPRKSALKLFKTCSQFPSIVYFSLRHYMYSFVYPLEYHVTGKVITYTSGENYMGRVKKGNGNMLLNAGWHCSFCFRYLDDITHKLQSYSHRERYRKYHENLNLIQKKIQNGNFIYDSWPEAFSFKNIWSLWPPFRKHISDDVPIAVNKDKKNFGFLNTKECIRERHNPITYWDEMYPRPYKK